jgi:hypothetical protein
MGLSIRTWPWKIGPFVSRRASCSRMPNCVLASRKAAFGATSPLARVSAKVGNPPMAEGRRAPLNNSSTVTGVTRPCCCWERWVSRPPLTGRHYAATVGFGSPVRSSARRRPERALAAASASAAGRSPPFWCRSWRASTPLRHPLRRAFPPCFDSVDTLRAK